MGVLNGTRNFKFLFILLTIKFIGADVTLYPHPSGIRSSDKFTVYVNHQQSFTYISTSDHRSQEVQHAHSHRSVSWTSFSITRGHAIVEVHTQTDFRQCIVRPKHYGYHCKRTGTKTAQFTIDSNRRMMSVEFDYDYGSTHKDITDKLLIFADPPETDVPKPNTLGVLFYSAGVTDLGGQKHLNASVQEVYLAPGAYVHGGFITTGHQSVKIHGRGVLSGEKYKFHDSRFNYALINMDKGSHHTVEGLVLVDPPYYFHRALSVHNTVRNMKTVGAWTYNSDGVSLGDNGLVEDSFIMANDDSIKLYNDDAVIRNCVVWQAQNGAVFQTGWWTQRHMQHVRVSDIDIIHTDWCTFKGNNCHLSDNNGVLDQTGNTKDFQISDVEFRNIRIEGIVPRIFNFDVHAGAVGHISDFSFVNWTIESQPMGDAIHNVIKGSSTAHVSRWHFENFKIGGKCISSSSPADMHIDQQTVFLMSFHCPSSPVVG